MPRGGFLDHLARSMAKELARAIWKADQQRQKRAAYDKLFKQVNTVENRTQQSARYPAKGNELQQNRVSQTEKVNDINNDLSSNISDLLTNLMNVLIKIARAVKRFVQEQAKQRAARNKVIEEERRQNIVLQTEKVDYLNNKLSSRMVELLALLEYSLSVNPSISFDNLQISNISQLLIPPKILSDPEPIPISREEYLARIDKPSMIEMLIPETKERYQNLLQLNEKKYSDYLVKFNQWLQSRRRTIQKIKTEFEKEKLDHLNKMHPTNQEKTDFEQLYRIGDPNAILEYCASILERSKYPDGFQSAYGVILIPKYHTLIIEYKLPGIEIVPINKEYKFNIAIPSPIKG